MNNNGANNNTNNGVGVLGAGLSEGRYNSGGYRYDNFIIPSMAFSQPFGGFAFSSQGSYPNTAQSPPMQAMPTMPTMLGTSTMTNQPPEWATVLMNDVKAIKSQVSKIESIETIIN